MAPDEENDGPTPTAIIEWPRTPGPYAYDDESQRVANRMNRDFADDLRATIERASRLVVPRDESTTLEYFMRDYVGHLKHHLQQIDPKLSDAPRRQRESSVLEDDVTPK